MARGSLAGIVSGVVVSGLALGVASLSLPPVEMGVTPPGAGAETPVVVEPLDTDAPEPEGMDDTGTAPEAAPDAGETPETGEMPEPGQEPADTGAAPETDPAAAPGADTEAEPVTGDETGADPASAPADGAEAEGAEDEDDTPMRGEAAEADLTPQPAGTPLPETDRAPQMEADPVKAPMVDPDEPVAIPGTELVEKLPPALPPASADETPDPVEPDAAEVTEPAALPDTTTDKAPGSALVVEPDPAPEPEPQAAPEPEPVSEAEPEPEPAPEPAPAPEIATIVAEPADPTPPVVTTPAPAPTPVAEPEPQPAPAPGLSGADSVVTGRLPTIGGDAPAQEPPAADTEAEPLDPAALADLPAIERNRIEFDVEGDQPLLALLLLDSGERAALEDIGKLPFPLTVAVDAGAPDAAEAIAFYATRGIEVALLLPLPDGATPSDVDVTIQAYGPLLEEVAEVVVDPGLGFQALGPGAVQLATNLAESGHGLVSFPAGLNTGHKAAEKLNVPAGLVFLDLDGDGQGGPVIRRFLDNAAFRARNEEGVIVLARTRAETLQALLEWSLGNRAQSVTMAPISAVLLAE